MKIRKATLNDFEKITELNHKLFVYEKKYSPVFNENWPFHNQGKEYFAKRLVNDNAITLVAEEHDEIVGYLVAFIDTFVVRNDNPLAELENIFVQTEHRNKGIGQELLDEFKKIAKEKNVKRLKVTCYSDNEGAIKLYKKNGFTDFAVTLETDL